MAYNSRSHSHRCKLQKPSKTGLFAWHQGLTNGQQKVKENHLHLTIAHPPLQDCKMVKTRLQSRSIWQQTSFPAPNSGNHPKHSSLSGTTDTPYFSIQHTCRTGRKPSIIQKIAYHSSILPPSRLQTILASIHTHATDSNQNNRRSMETLTSLNILDNGPSLLKPRSHSRMKSYECALIANVNS